MVNENKTLDFHLNEVFKGNRQYENVFQSITRMILDGGFESINVLGKTAYDFNIFRQGKKHMVGMFDEINSFVSFVKDAAEGGSSSEMAYVLVGEPGNGKTFFVDYLCNLYRNFLSQPKNRRFTFKFTNLDKLGTYSALKEAQSQTFEDPLVLAMNLFGATEKDRSKNITFLEDFGFKDQAIESFFENYRPLGACSDFILNEIREFTDGNVEKIIKEHLEIVPVPLSPTQGTVTGKYAAGDKITASKADLVGESDIQKSLLIGNFSNPHRFDVQKGALARVGGGGIHFADELFKNKPDLIQVYLGVIQNRIIELDGFIWPLDSLIIATSNNEEFNRFKENGEQAPIVDRCRTVYMSHNTHYKLQRELTKYALGNKQRTTFTGKKLHQDPLLVDAVSDAAVLTRLPQSQKLTPIEIMKLAAGEIAEDKSLQSLAEFIDELSRNIDITKRFGQKGLGQRDVGRSLQILMEKTETHEGGCMCALDIFDTLERVILDYVQSNKEQGKFLEDVSIAKELYRKNIKKVVFDAYMNQKDAIKTDVKNYINMVIALGDDNLKQGDYWSYRDRQTGKVKKIKIEDKYVNSVEDRLGLKTDEEKETYRTKMRKIFAQKIQRPEDYDFMDQHKLVEAVTEVRLNSDVNNAGSLIGALANREDDKNKKLYVRMMDTMVDELGYCPTCAEKTLDYYCTKKDES